MEDDTLYCCGKPSVLNVVSVNLQFYFCKECRQEVKELDIMDGYYDSGYQYHRYGYLLKTGEDEDAPLYL